MTSWLPTKNGCLWYIAPSESWRTCPPSASQTKMWLVAASTLPMYAWKRSHLPSGDQVGWQSLRPGSSVSFLTPVSLPLASIFAFHKWKFSGLPSSENQDSHFPSGDGDGCLKLIFGLARICSRTEGSSTRMRHSSHGVVALVW